MRRLLPLLFRGAPLLLPGLALLALAFALGSEAAAGTPGTAPIATLPLLAVACVVGALHRPWGAFGLGAGAATLPVAAVLFGPAAAGVCAAAASVAGSAWDSSLPGAVPRPWHAALQLASLHTVAAIAGTAVASLASGHAPVAIAALGGTAYLAALAALHLLGRALRQPQNVAAVARLGPSAVGVEALAWSAGALLAAAFDRAGGLVGGGLLAFAALLAAEAARQRRLRCRAEVGRHALDRLGRAGARLVRDPSPLADLAHQIHRECLQVVPFSWFCFELVGASGGAVTRCWHSGPDHLLRPGSPRLPRHPPPLPGVHRRAQWRQLRRPLVAGDQQLAELALWCDPRRVLPAEIELLDRLVPQLAGLVHRAVLDREAREDPLTGVALRRVLDSRLAESFERCRQEGGHVSVVLVDLDFFKRINDRFGHAAGDRALTAVATVLTANLREGDLCARYGGEEFTLLLEQLDGAAALAIAERLREEVEALHVAFEGETLELSLSAGVVCFPEVHSRSPDELLQLADTALYEAKRLGRNCCLLYCGPGQYVDGKGRQIDTGEGAGTGPRAPQIFA